MASCACLAASAVERGRKAVTPERYARVKDLFHRSADLSAQARRELLDRECGDDVELRHEVESLLQNDLSRTLIAFSDTTVADFSRSPTARTLRGVAARQFRQFKSLTKHLSPQGHLAIGALLSGILLTLLAYFGNRSVHSFQRELRREAINEIVDSKVTGLRMWLEHETAKAESWARSDRLQNQIGQLVELARQSNLPASSLAESPIQQQIRDELESLSNDEVHFSIWDRRHILIADTFEGDRIGQSSTPWGAGVLATVFGGESQLFAFDRDNSINRFDESIEVEPHLGIVTPIRDGEGQVIAALMIHDEHSREAGSRILRMVRLGESGESYIFNRNGLMLSESRFSKQLQEFGLLPDDPDWSAVRSIYLRDPGGDLSAGFIPDEPQSAWPLTKMARLCTSGHDGDDLDGYRDYRGVLVVGAWRWVDDLEFGVATEIDFREAEPGLRVLYWETVVVFVLFAVCLGFALFSYYSVHRLRQRVGENGKLGQYRLEKQIGEGGMGKVFKATHELLKRPTAVKLLKPELIDQQSILRFEREARLVSQLEHANTIRVYDYGSTPEGLFYFVMEYIDGLSLGELVELETALPPSRCILLLRQICCSLREAHQAGLVHRDIKPSNIMVCERAGEFDFVKVLDFGLVKPTESPLSQKITSTNLIAGTPQYLAPERLVTPETNDPRSDIYALGAVVFYLLTGRDFIEGNSLAKMLLQVVEMPPLRPSEITDVSIPQELDDLVFRCLAKDPSDRPDSVTEIIATLDRIRPASPWSESDAASWWKDLRARLLANE